MRIVCISDTHGLHNQIRVPDGDALVHAGDFTNNGQAGQVVEFAEWFANQPHARKVVTPGNHDFYCEKAPDLARKLFEQPRVHYLVDQSVVIDGVIFYGSPWQPRFFDWAFNLDRGALLKAKWDLIPNGVNVLVTHGPPIHFLDATDRSQSVGCADLAVAVNTRLHDLKLHVFGHIHESYGYYRDRHIAGERVFANAATCNLKYKPINPPLVFDLVDGKVTVVTEQMEANG